MREVHDKVQNHGMLHWNFTTYRAAKKPMFHKMLAPPLQQGVGGIYCKIEPHADATARRGRSFKTGSIAIRALRCQ